MKRFNLPTWKDLAHFFEHGDLTPIAVIISVAHYGPVLNDKSDHIIVAFLVGALIDLIHFRTVRRLFQVSGRNRIVGHGVIAVMTTIIAAGYHLRFYENDLLLALPIPIGIGILAQHAAANVHDITVDRWRNRVKLLLTVGKKLRASVMELTTRVSVLQSHVARLQGYEMENKELHERAAALETTNKTLQDNATQLQQANKSLQNRVTDLERLNKELKEAAKHWLAINSEYQTYARLNAGSIGEDEAAALVGADVRTVRSRAAKMNGVNHE